MRVRKSLVNPQMCRDVNLLNSLTFKSVKFPQCLPCVATQEILESIFLREDLTFNLLIVKIVDKGTKQLRNKFIVKGGLDLQSFDCEDRGQRY